MKMIIVLVAKQPWEIYALRPSSLGYRHSGPREDTHAPWTSTLIYATLFELPHVIYFY